MVIFIPLRMIWITRVGAIPGKYAAGGVWGNATLEVKRDGIFVETWHFKTSRTAKLKMTDRREAAGVMKEGTGSHHTTCISFSARNRPCDILSLTP
jgi:hypothetical protein